MAQFNPDELEILYLRGFEPAEGYNPLEYTYSHYVTYESYYGDQESTEFPRPICDLNWLPNLEYSASGIDKIVWFSKVSAGDSSTPPGAAGIEVVGGSHPSGDAHVSWGDFTVYFLDEQGNRLANPFWINLEGIPDGSFAVPGNMARLVLCYRTDITPPSFHFGISYIMARYMSFPHDPEDIKILSERMVHLGNQGTGIPNEPFYSWYNKNRNSGWYDTSQQNPPLLPDGGGGSFMRPTDQMGEPALPTFDIAHSDFLRLYSLTEAQFTELADYLWDPNFANSIAKNQASPFENIVACYLTPLVAELSSTAATIQIGNQNTGVSAAKISDTILRKDFGRVSFDEIYHSFADYSGFTKLQIYLPYIGKRELNPDNYMAKKGGKLHLVYHIDAFTGSCVAHLISEKNGVEILVDSYNGNCNCQVPINGANYATMYQSQLNGLATMVSGVVSGNGGSLVGGLNNIMFAKPSYEKSGTLTGSYGRFAAKTPYVFFDTPLMKEADSFRHLHGYKSDLNVRLGDCTGFVSVKYIDLNNFTASDTIKERILTKLQQGVYIN